MSVLVPSLSNHHHAHRFEQQENDHVPFGVVNSMKQRLLNKVNESYFNSTLSKHSITKQASTSNENLLQTKTNTSPLKHSTRLSRSQDNLNNHVLPEQITSYIQAKQEVIIVETTVRNDELLQPQQQQGCLHPAQKTLIHKQSYTELHVDEAPKPGTVTTVKNMFERQIRLSRYDGDKIFNSSTPSTSRMNSQHRDQSSPTNRSRSISPYDHAYRQKRTIIATSITTTALSLPVPTTSYPDLVISHTPPTDTTKSSNEQKTHLPPTRQTNSHEQLPLNIHIDDNITNQSNSNNRPNLLLTSISNTSETIDCQPLDFKSRLALFNRTNLQQSNEQTHLPAKKSFTKNLHQSTFDEPKKESHIDTIQNQFSRTVVNTAKAITFFGGNKLNDDNQSSLPSSIPAPIITDKFEQSANELPQTPDIIGGNVKLNKSSIYSGIRKHVRVQFIDGVDTFEYPSFEVALAEFGSTTSDNDDNDDDQSSSSSNENNQYEQQQQLDTRKTHQPSRDDDVDDDELDRLARINAEFNTNNLSEKSLKPKGTLHTFRPTHIDHYELGTQHQNPSNMSDMSTCKQSSYTILARQKLLFNSDMSHSKATFDLQNNIQWSSMSTTTDLLF